ncbi:MAG: phenylacetate-CoA oxygenase subunit PaaJ [Bacteroidia bacterium]|nr:phenylacetate-CoA oxygenase subunit PaaJ [Bacteroidia bacterium]
MTITEEEIWQCLETVSDPEIPVLSIVDLGIVRTVQIKNDNAEISITPTYSGCPAIGVIGLNIIAALEEKYSGHFSVKTVLSPPWTTDWMSESGKQKLRDYGIAPPVPKSTEDNGLFADDVIVECPQCQSSDTTLISWFGSTACKALYKCNKCLEPFDYFKCHR